MSKNQTDKELVRKILSLSKDIDSIKSKIDDLLRLKVVLCNFCNKMTASNDLIFYSLTDDLQREESDIVIMCKKCANEKGFKLNGY